MEEHVSRTCDELQLATWDQLANPPLARRRQNSSGQNAPAPAPEIKRRKAGPARQAPRSSDESPRALDELNHRRPALQTGCRRPMSSRQGERARPAHDRWGGRIVPAGGSHYRGHDVLPSAGGGTAASGQEKRPLAREGPAASGRVHTLEILGLLPIQDKPYPTAEA